MKTVKKINAEYVIPSNKENKKIHKMMEEIKIEDKNINPKTLKKIDPKKTHR